MSAIPIERNYYPESESYYDISLKTVKKFLLNYGTNSNILTLCGVFVLGMLIQRVIFSSRKVSKAKVEEINKLF